MHVIPSPKESMPQALYCRRDTQLSLELMYIIRTWNTQCSCYVEVSVSEWNRYNCSYHVCSIWPMIYLFSFQHAVVVKFHRNDRLMRQYRACAIASFGLGITCIFYISLYYVYKPSWSCLLCFLCHPYIPILIRRIFTLLVPSHSYTI